MNWHRTLAVALAVLGAGALHAAMEMPSGIFRGNMETVEGSNSGGEINARALDGTIYSCTYDFRTYIEINKWKVAADHLQPGDPVEVLADRRPGSRACYVRMLHVVPAAQLRPARKPSQAERPPDPVPPRGDRTFSGVVIRRDASRFTLKTRTGEETLALRGDTRFLVDGSRQTQGELSVNTRVFVRAGRNLQGQLEAYQVMWGDILEVPAQ